LRYYGTSKSIGTSGEVDLNENNKISFRVMQEKEDLERRNKFEEGGILAPIQIFDRNMDRSTYALSYTGKNVLAAVDWLEHKQLDLNATMNTAVNDQHLLSYGIGYTEERASGTRLKRVPESQRWTRGIDP